MSVFRIKQGEQRLPLTVPVQFAGAKPNPVPTAATMRLTNKTNGQVHERTMQIDASPTDRIFLVYDFQASDWSGPNALPVGYYRAVFVMTQGGEPTVAPSIGYDLLIIEVA
jgi:hypothetical protein